jgi:hypothetical protein
MSEEQAFKILVDATAQLSLTRAQHELVLKALEVLKPKAGEHAPVVK